MTVGGDNRYNSRFADKGQEYPQFWHSSRSRRFVFQSLVDYISRAIIIETFMSVLPIYTYGAPVLRKKAHPVKQVTDDVVALIMDMFETMRKAGGIGLAATQVGEVQRVVVIDVSETEGLTDVKPFSMINPEVLEQTGSVRIEEGCLSIPDVRDEVDRAERIRIRFRDSNFDEVEAEVSGLLARVILHEIDHLNGVLFLDHLAPQRKTVHQEKLKQIQRGEMEVSYPVVTAADVTV